MGRLRREVEVEVKALGIEGVVDASIFDGKSDVKEVDLEAQRADNPGEGSPGIHCMFEMVSLAVGVRAYGCVPKADPIINEACVAVEIIAIINEEAIFFLDAIVDGSKRWQRTASTHRDSFGLLHNDVAELEDIVLDQNFNGVEDGMLTGVQTQCTRD
jgi:hypothetical protein